MTLNLTNTEASFIDHESGITKCHYAIDPECYTKDKLYFINLDGADVNDTDERVNTYATTEEDDAGILVIEFNGAMEPSETVCFLGYCLIYTTCSHKRSKSLWRILYPKMFIVRCDNVRDTMYALITHRKLRILSDIENCSAL